MTTTDIILTLATILADERLGDKVYGRRNYAIITYDDHFFKMGFGDAKRRGMLGWYLSTMREHNIHIWAYTYKKDCDATAERLIEMGYKQR